MFDLPVRTFTECYLLTFDEAILLLDIETATAV